MKTDTLNHKRKVSFHKDEIGIVKIGLETFISIRQSTKKEDFAASGRIHYESLLLEKRGGVIQ
jgi:hypothetical protein